MSETTETVPSSSDEQTQEGKSEKALFNPLNVIIDWMKKKGYSLPEELEKPQTNEESIEPEDEVEIPELDQTFPEQLEGSLSEKQILRNAQRRFNRLARQVYHIFYPPAQSLYLRNPVFREKLDECDREFQKAERSQNRETGSIIDYLFPFRNAPPELCHEFLQNLKRECIIEARDPEKYEKENPLPPLDQYGRYYWPLPENQLAEMKVENSSQ